MVVSVPSPFAAARSVGSGTHGCAPAAAADGEAAPDAGAEADAGVDAAGAELGAVDAGGVHAATSAKTAVSTKPRPSERLPVNLVLHLRGDRQRGRRRAGSASATLLLRWARAGGSTWR